MAFSDELRKLTNEENQQIERSQSSHFRAKGIQQAIEMVCRQTAQYRKQQVKGYLSYTTLSDGSCYEAYGMKDIESGTLHNRDSSLDEAVAMVSSALAGHGFTRCNLELREYRQTKVPYQYQNANFLIRLAHQQELIHHVLWMDIEW